MKYDIIRGMIRSFGNDDTAKIFYGERSRRFPPEIQNIARRKLRMIASAKFMDDLKVPPGNRLEKLVGNLSGNYSIRINLQWRIVFQFEDGGAENVRIEDYHK